MNERRGYMPASLRDDWRTPVAIYRRFVPPAFDTSDRHGGTFDALRDRWPEPWFCNPPYGRELPQWARRMVGDGVALLPARTDTEWFHRHVKDRARIEFVRGRLHYDDAGPAPFASILAHFGPRRVA